MKGSEMKEEGKVFFKFFFFFKKFVDRLSFRFLNLSFSIIKYWNSSNCLLDELGDANMDVEISSHIQW